MRPHFNKDRSHKVRFNQADPIDTRAQARQTGAAVGRGSQFTRACLWPIVRCYYRDERICDWASDGSDNPNVQPTSANRRTHAYALDTCCRFMVAAVRPLTRTPSLGLFPRRSARPLLALAGPGHRKHGNGGEHKSHEGPPDRLAHAGGLHSQDTTIVRLCLGAARTTVMSTSTDTDTSAATPPNLPWVPRIPTPLIRKDCARCGIPSISMLRTPRVRNSAPTLDSGTGVN